MSDIAVGIYGIVILLALFLTGLEMAYCMILVGFVGFTFLMSFSAASNLVVKDFFDTFTTYSYTVIPLFIMMGELAQNSNIAKRLYVGAHKWFGHIPGGLAMTTVMGATAFKAMCGSTLATVGTFSGLAIPEMDRYGYKKELSAGTIASVSTIGMILPPSTVLIIYGLQVEQSIGRLFLAGILPALMISLFFMIVIAGWVIWRPEIAPRAERATWGERIAAIPDGIIILVIFGIVIGGMITGFFSPTEAGTIGAAAVLILALVKEKFTFRGFIRSIDEALRTGCMVLMLVAASTVLGHFLAVTEIPMRAGDWITSLPLNRHVIMVFIIFIYLIGGSFIDDLAFMILATPVFYPAVQKLGFDPLWFGIIIAVTVMVGIVVPPVASNVFIVHKLTNTPMSTVYKGVVPFLMGIVFFGILLFIFPQIALFLPNYLMK